MNYTDEFIGAEGLNFPANGKPLFQEDFAAEHDGLFDELSGREIDIVSAGILSGFECSIGTDVGTVIIAVGCARDIYGRRVISNNAVTVQIPNGTTVRIVVRHKWANIEYTPDGSAEIKKRRTHSSEIVAIDTSIAALEKDVALWNVSRVGSAITINGDLRVLSNFKLKAFLSQMSNVSGCLTPVGSIVAHMPGYFTNGSNAGFTAQAITLSACWKLCDGSLLNDPESPIFNGAGRYLPNLTDNRFLMGSNTPGSIGGQNSYQITTSNLPPHVHSINHSHGPHSHTGSTGLVSNDHAHTTGYYGGQFYWSGVNNGSCHLDTGALGLKGAMLSSGVTANHTHAYTTDSVSISSSGYSGDGGFSNVAIENRPLYISCKYIMRIK